MTERDERALAEELELLAEAESRGEVDAPTLHPARQNQSEVFSIRLPTDAAAELRRRAEAEGVTAGALLRKWVLGTLGGGEGNLLTQERAEKLFREALERAASDAISSVTEAHTPRTSVNLGPRLVHRSDSHRHRA